jgi:integrase
MASVRQLTKPNREGKRPWVVEYTDSAGRRRRTTPKSGMKVDADKMRVEVERELGTGLHVVKGSAPSAKDIARLMTQLADMREERNRWRALAERLAATLDVPEAAGGR